MKKRVKEGLDDGTHVSPEVYDLLAKTSNWFADRLVEHALLAFEKEKHLGSSRRMNKVHVMQGYFYLMVEHGIKEDD